MKILFLSDNFPPEVNAPAQRTFEHCRRWVKMGADVTVITCAPNFPQGRLYEGYRNRLRYAENMEGVRVVRVWSYISPNQGFLRRVADYSSFALSASLAGLFEKGDVIMATSPQFFTALAGFVLSLLKRRPWVFEVRDLWPESIVAVEALKRGAIIRMLERLELFLYKRADCIVALTDAFRERIAARGVDAQKIDVVKNGVDAQVFFPAPKDKELERRFGLENKFVVGYLGTHGMAHKLDFILRCAAKLPPEDNTHFLFAGDGAERERLLALKEELGLKNVTMLDAVPRAQAPLYLGLCDVALVPLKRCETFTTVIPSKIFEAAAMERPILLGVDGEARALVESYAAGLFFEPENTDSFLEQLQIIKNDTALFWSLKQGCRRLAAEHSRDTLAEVMFKVLQKLCPSGDRLQRW